MSSSRLRSLRLWLAAVLLATGAGADEVPAPLQARLLATISTHVFSLPPEGPIEVLIVYPESAGEGSREAQTLAQAIVDAESNRFHTSLAPYRSGADLKTIVTRRHPNIVYASAGLDEKSTAGIVDACEIDGLLTIAEEASSVRLGIILGFTLVEAKPRLVINLPRAQHQKVRLSSALVSLAQVIR